MDERTFLARFNRPHEDAPPVAHPGAFPAPQGYRADWEDFAHILTAVGGMMLAPMPDWRSAVQAVIDLDPGPVTASLAAQPWLAGLGGWTPAGDPAIPHRWATSGLGILVGELAVAENAAVLLTSRTLPERALCVLCQRLLLLVPRTALVADHISAQRLLSARATPAREHHRTWLSGPSKTADIEQSLVIGAHGARALMVAVVDPAP